VNVVGTGFAASDGTGRTTRFYNNERMGIVRVYHKNQYRYAMNNQANPHGEVTGWFSRDMIRPNVENVIVRVSNKDQGRINQLTQEIQNATNAINHKNGEIAALEREIAYK
jgi:hypothetical protein